MEIIFVIYQGRHRQQIQLLLVHYIRTDVEKLLYLPWKALTLFENGKKHTRWMFTPLWSPSMLSNVHSKNALMAQLINSLSHSYFYWTLKECNCLSISKHQMTLWIACHLKKISIFVLAFSLESDKRFRSSSSQKLVNYSMTAEIVWGGFDDGWRPQGGQRGGHSRGQRELYLEAF